MALWISMRVMTCTHAGGNPAASVKPHTPTAAAKSWNTYQGKYKGPTKLQTIYDLRYTKVFIYISEMLLWSNAVFCCKFTFLCGNYLLLLFLIF